MSTIVKKLAEARRIVSGTKMKKAGKNTYSNYEYFTPEQVHKLVDDACREVGLLCLFGMTRNEFGITGSLTLMDVDGDENMTVPMATDIPEIKATNIAQQLGGAMTYTERYLKQSVFGIVDNSLDFDTTENTKKVASAPKKEVAAPKLQTMTEQTYAYYEKNLGTVAPAKLIESLKKYDIKSGFGLKAKNLVHNYIKNLK